MKVGIVGYGYWGKIIYANLKNFVDDESIFIYDSISAIGRLEDIYQCDKVFVITPTITHFDIVKDLLSRGIDVFCEKPLTTHTKECELLYDIAQTNKSQLFVDWIFTFNDAVNYIKDEYENGSYGGIRSVRMNRLNSGPERKDVSAKWDLTSHDVSILCHLFGKIPNNVLWNLYKRSDSSFVSDTCVGILMYDNFDAILHSSWEYGKKDRVCIFEFDAGFVKWDDASSEIKFNGDLVDYPRTKNPLENSIEAFLYKDFNQKNLTLDIVRILEQGE